MGQSPQPPPPAPLAPNQRPARSARQTARRYFIVNPHGTIHEVTRDHAAERLRQAGWRMATNDEIAELERRGGNQVHDRPICQPWSPDPDVQLLPE